MNVQEYLTDNIIAYIGNKRKLLSLIEQAVSQTGVLKTKKEPTFLDLFAGSGVVSRLAKTLGFKVATNDWEHYSYIINKAFIELDHDFLDKSFVKLGGIDNVLDVLNGLSTPKEEDAYISKFYCPDDDDNPDTTNERMFYTNYNGKKIDAIRAKIEEWKTGNLINDDEYTLLLALLLYEASTRSNTSGVFKGFHKGFGGTNGDALTRILKPISFKRPTLVNGKKSKVYNNDAVVLAKELKEPADIAYLDPPYNQHQYGSNYHLLNTIALNDKPTINKNIYVNGKKTDKSAIRKDWVKTKSTFCYKKSAQKDFEKLIRNIKAKYLLISYSTDGIIDFDTMLKILGKKGKLSIATSEYVKYRGGKQALTTKVHNIEFVLIVNTQETCTKEDMDNIKKTLVINKLSMFMKRTINPIRAHNVGYTMVTNNYNEAGIERYYDKTYNGKKIVIGVNNNKISNYELVVEKLYDLSLEVLEGLYDDLNYVTNLTKEDEVYLTLDEIRKYYKLNMHKKAVEQFKEVTYYLSKFNNKKAYIPSLKSIVAVFDMMIQTVGMWRDYKILKQSSFKRFEKILLKKLSHNIYKEGFDVKKPEHISEENMSMLREVEALKNKIASLYEHFMNEVEKEDAYQTRNFDDIQMIHYQQMPTTSYDSVPQILH